MANAKISQLPSATTPLAGSELVEIVQGGINKQVTAQDVADLGGGAVDSVNGQTGVVVLDAGDIAFTPGGTIAATDVQGAIAEVASEKLALSGGTMSGNIAMGSNKVTGLAAATANGEAVPFEQIPPKVIQLAASDESTPITSGTNKITFRMPYAMTLTAVRASLTTAQASGSIFTVDINEGGSTILSTKLTIDNTEKTSTTAAAAAVISDSSLADDAEITIDVDQIGDGTAVGLKITLIGV